MTKTGIADWLLVLGGTLAVSVSIILIIWLVTRQGASINLLNAVTWGLGLTGGTIILVYPDRLRLLVAANLALLVAAAPAVFGPVWLLYVLPIVLVAIGTALKILGRCIADKRLTG